jgi:hypothetical protein
MHQNKFHTETIQRLKENIEASAKGGQQLDEYEKNLAEHLKILYKFANKGIRGRGKKRESEEMITPILTPNSERGSEGRGLEQLLPPPVSNASARVEAGSFTGLSTTSSWNRNERMMSEDVFLGNHGHVQNTFLGSQGDGGISGYSFGSMG